MNRRLSPLGWAIGAAALLLIVVLVVQRVAEAWP